MRHFDAQPNIFMVEKRRVQRNFITHMCILHIIQRLRYGTCSTISISFFNQRADEVRN